MRGLRTGLLAALLGGAIGCGGGAFAADASMAPPPTGVAREAMPAGMAPSEPRTADGAYEFRGADEEAAGDTGGPPPPMAPPGPGAPPSPNAAPPPPAGPDGKPQPGQVAQVRAPILIYTANFSLAVFEVDASLRAVEDMAREFGGFLARRDQRSITVRVPASRFEEALRKVEKLGDVLARNVVAEDVTEEYLDLEVRLKNARAMRERLEQLLAKAQKVEESLVIERELSRVAGEIERLEGRMKYLRDRAAFSTLTVTFEPRRKNQPLPNRPVNLPIPWLYELGIPRLLNL